MVESSDGAYVLFAKALDQLIGCGPADPRGAVVQILTFDGKRSLQGASGVSRPDTRAPMACETRFHHASIGKTYTAVLVLQLVEEGAFGSKGLDAPFADLDVLPRDALDRLLRHEEVDYSRHVTLRHLLTHTSGMRDAMVDDHDQLGGPAPGSLIGAALANPETAARRWWSFDPLRLDDPVAGVFNFYLANNLGTAALAPPGVAFHYSDTGFVLLALTCERFAGCAYHELLRRRISVPLGLTQTYVAYRDDPDDLGPERQPEAEVYMGVQPCLSAGIDLSFDWGGGGTVSTVDDLAAFFRSLMEGALFRSSTTLREMTDWVSPPGLAAPRTGVGLGLFRTTYGARELWGHSGAWGARMFLDPNAGLLIAGTLNQASVDPAWHVPMFSLAEAAFL